MAPKDGGLETRPTGYGETVGVGWHSLAPKDGGFKTRPTGHGETVGVGRHLMAPKDGGLETRPTGYGETVGVGRHSHAAERRRVQNPLYGIWRNGRHRTTFPWRRKKAGSKPALRDMEKQ